MPPKPAPDELTRAAIMDALTESVAVRGYSSVTINDIVDRAHVSKSTFYAQFSGKEECFLDAYERSADEVLEVLIDSASGDDPYDERVHAAAAAYLGLISADPVRARAFFLEVLAAGPTVLAMRHQVNRRFADLLRRLVDEADDPRVGKLDESSALLVVGGANELVISAIVENRLVELPAAATAVSRALLAAVSLPRNT